MTLLDARPDGWAPGNATPSEGVGCAHLAQRHQPRLRAESPTYIDPLGSTWLVTMRRLRCHEEWLECRHSEAAIASWQGRHLDEDLDRSRGTQMVERFAPVMEPFHPMGQQARQPAGISVK